jgi:hypothetical protein
MLYVQHMCPFLLALSFFVFYLIVCMSILQDIPFKLSPYLATKQPILYYITNLISVCLYMIMRCHLPIACILNDVRRLTVPRNRGNRARSENRQI